jgi:hypothetical protein
VRYRLTLHCGLHKTGTTTIQHALQRDRGALAAQGVFYPDPKEGVSHNSFFRPERAHELQEALGAFLQTGLEHLLLSAEDLATHFLYPRRAGAIRNTFAKLFDIEIVIYLRRQDRLKESVFSEIVKRGSTGSIEQDTHYALDFLARLDVLADTFGRDALRVRLYREEPMSEGWLIDDFCTAAGLDRSALSVDGARHNTAFHRRKTLLLSEMPVGGSPAARAFIRFLEVADLPRDDRIRFLGAPAYHRAILEGQRRGNDLVAYRYALPAPIPHFEWTEEHAAWHPPEPIGDDERAALLRAFLAG